jgi:hypothetical protein
LNSEVEADSGYGPKLISIGRQQRDARDDPAITRKAPSEPRIAEEDARSVVSPDIATGLQKDCGERVPEEGACGESMA